MPKTNIYNQKGEQVGEIELSDKVFGVKVRNDLVHQAIVAQTANERQVLAHTKGRSEVRGGGRKPWRQKGTGRARQGSIRSPQWIGGGIVFGPLKTRNFSQKINKKMKVKAIFMALSDKVSNDKLVVLDKLDIQEYKTKIFNGIINSLAKQDKKAKKQSVLVVNDAKNEKVKYSAKNLPGVKLINLDNINIVDLLKYKKLILTVGTVKNIEEKYK